MRNHLGLISSVEECKNMIKSVDSDDNGCVDFEEFKKMMMMTNYPFTAYISIASSVLLFISIVF